MGPALTRRKPEAVDDRAVPAELIERCRDGDRDALEQVLRTCSPYVERVLVRMVGPGADVDDLLQNTLIAVVEAFPRFRGEAKVTSWMTGIAINVARQHFRRPERRRKVSLELVPDDREVTEARADTSVAERRRLERLYHHLDSVGTKKRIAFVLHVFEGKSIEEVAALTGASKSATKSRIFWARKALLGRARKDPVLREFLDECGGDA